MDSKQLPIDPNITQEETDKVVRAAEAMYATCVDILVKALPEAKAVGEKGVSYTDTFRDHDKGLIVQVMVAIMDEDDEEELFGGEETEETGDYTGYYADRLDKGCTEDIYPEVEEGE